MTRSEKHVRPLGGIGAAFIFLTRLPIPGWPYTKAEFAAAPAHFSLVGFVLGLLLGGLCLFLQPLGSLASGLLTLGFSLLLTGCFHEDGLADTADAIGGSFTREKLFEILKDSRIGSYGGAALVISLVGRAALIGELGGAVVWAFPLVWSWARVFPVWLMALMTYATPEKSRSRDLAGASWVHAVRCTLWAALGTLMVFLYTPTVILGVALMLPLLFLATVWCALLFQKKAGGYTGDFLGATEQVCELLGFAALVWALSTP
ncbi:MAG: adenosylcobinamide-GDP ribazoletransferase [Candidatus Sumerlaeia bacterium]|nr:adenosylcobinamide-GDP ribazoletransferase [Candidatus Sumerlaeia bacterium]